MESPITPEYKEPEVPQGEPFADLRQLLGFIQTVSSAPTWTPRKFMDQFAVYANGVTYRLYIYDTTNGAWRYVALT